MSPNASSELRRRAKGLVVGVDGSSGSIQALAWAANRTDRFGLIQPVATWRFPWWTMSGPVLPVAIPAFDDMERIAVRLAEEAVASVPKRLRRPTIISEAAAGPTLVAHGADAEMIVVGTRGRGAIADTLLGSVSCYVVAHATVPTVVVPATADTSTADSHIIVGVDGSENAIRALEWALGRAGPHETVEVVHAWNPVLAAYPEAPMLPTDHLEAAANATMERTVAAAIEHVPSHRCRLVRTVVEGDPRLVIPKMAESAGLLVVGARGHRGLAHAILGSVSTSLVHQPVTTTVVVPAIEP